MINFESNIHIRSANYLRFDPDQKPRYINVTFKYNDNQVLFVVCLRVTIEIFRIHG